MRHCTDGERTSSPSTQRSTMPLISHPAVEAHAFRGAVVVEDGVALAGETFVQLDRDAPQPGVTPLQLDDSLRDVLLVAKMLEPVRQRHARLPEHLPAPALGAQVVQFGIVTVQRYAEPHREAPLQGRAVEAAQVRRLGICDGASYAV